MDLSLVNAELCSFNYYAPLLWVFISRLWELTVGPFFSDGVSGRSWLMALQLPKTDPDLSGNGLFLNLELLSTSCHFSCLRL